MAAAVLAAAPMLIKESRPDREVRLNLPGALSITGGLLAVVYGLTAAAEGGWGEPVVAAAALAWLFLRDRHHRPRASAT